MSGSAVPTEPLVIFVKPDVPPIWLEVVTPIGHFA